MSACPQCGTVAKPSDKFCNVCGTPIAQAGGPAAPPPAYGAPPPPPGFGPPPPGPGGFGPPPAAFGPPGPGGFQPPPPAPGYGGGPTGARCQMGHDIPPGASYCPQGHPIALDQMQFAPDQYGGGQGGFGPPPQQGFGAQPPPAFAPQQPPPAFGPPPQAPGFAPPGPGGYGAPPPPAPAFGPPPQAPGFPPQAPQGFAPPQPAFGAPPAPAPPMAANVEPSGGPVPGNIIRGFLVAYGSNPAGDFWPLKGGRLAVGRQGGGDGIEITLQDPTISSRHAAVLVDAASGGVSVEDTGSTNGTFVNDEHIGFNGRRELRDGDRLRFGGFTTIVKVIGRV
jgi:FHA domain